MDKITNNDLTSQYQDLLDTYSHQLSATASLPPITPATTTASSTPLSLNSANPQPQSNFQKLFFLFSLIIFLIVTGAIVSTLLNRKELVVSDISPTPTLSISNETKTYSNPVQGYEFQFPGKYTPSVDNDIVTINTGIDGSNNRIIFSSATDSSVSILEYLAKIDEISKTAYEGQPAIEIHATKDTLINGLNCVQREEYNLAADQTHIKTYCQNNSVFVTITLLPGSGYPLDEKLYNQILSTFNFLSTSIHTITDQNLDKGWYYGNINQKKIDTPSEWVFEEAGRSSCWHRLGVLCGQ